MPHLLDTNAWIAFFKGRNSLLVDRIKKQPDDGIVLCSVVKTELWFGAHRYADSERRRNELQTLFDLYTSFAFDDAAASICADLRYRLESEGSRIGGNDLMIASIALANGLTVVTHNTREFSRVPGLQVLDWEI